VAEYIINQERHSGSNSGGGESSNIDKSIDIKATIMRQNTRIIPWVLIEYVLLILQLVVKF
jgi:hypothetical protein